MSTQQDYPWIRVWGKYLGSSPYYIDDQVAEARRDGAPQDAIYKDSDTEEWRTIDTITSPHTRRVLGLDDKEV
jgi:hypothetical protein